MLPQLLLLLLPLLRRIALGRPRVYRRDLCLQRRVHETVSREEGLLVELGGDDYCIEGLTAAACARASKWAFRSMPRGERRVYPCDILVQSQAAR